MWQAGHIAGRAVTTTVAYVVEGPIKGWGGTVGGSMGAVSRVANARIEAAIVKTSVRDGIAVLRTKDAAHTAEAIGCLYEALKQGERFTATTPTAAALAGSGGEYATLLKKRKRDNLDAPTTWRAMLATVPGLSAHKAAAVATAYPSMNALCAASAADLAAVRVPPASSSSSKPHTAASASTSGAEKKTPTARRLGPAIAQRLVELQRCVCVRERE